jgi:hypothetical protein
MRASKITLLVAFLIGAFIGFASQGDLTPNTAFQGGWSQTDTFDNNLARALDPNLKWSIPDDWVDSGQGKTRLLNEDYEEVHGEPYTPRNQGKAPSCVGQAAAAAVDFLATTEITDGQPERAPPAHAHAGIIYGLSRQEIGELGPYVGGGSMNIWAVQALRQYGAVARLNYPFLGHDLRVPNSTQAIKFGMEGCPDGLERIAKLHPVKNYYSINSYSDLRDAVYAGCPVIIGSRQGFGNGVRTRDAEGFLNPPRRLFFPSRWNHSMVCIGVCDSGRRGALILNSWGTEWINGPTRFDSDPQGSFWVDASIIDSMVKQKDSYALEGFKGYRRFNIFNRK